MLKVFSLIPLSLIDCRKGPCMVIFLSGCNMRCPYCQNYPAYLKGKPLDLESLRRMIQENWAVDIVKFTGGEPTLHRDSLLDACRVVKEEGLGLAIDTNGTLPEVVSKVARMGLTEAAVDFKAPRRKYKMISGLDAYDSVLASIRILLDYGVDTEIRTTVVFPIITTDDLLEIGNVLNKLGVRLWVLQAFRPTEYTPSELRSPTLSWLRKIAQQLSEEYSMTIKVR